MTMFNPEIIKQSDPYETEESCLSLFGGPRKTKRYKKSEFSMKLLNSNYAQKHLKAGQLRLFSTKLTIVTEF